MKVNEALIVDDLLFPIKVDSEKFSAIKKDIYIAKTIEVGSQFIYFEKIQIHPTRIALFMDLPESNTHEIFRFDDIALEDEKGNRWIHDGAHINEENKKVLYFHSNYFSEPEKLDIVFSSFTALPKEELEVLIDLDSERFLKVPGDKRFKKVWVEKDMGDMNGLYVQVQIDEEDHDYFFSIFNGSITDAEGTVFEYDTQSYGVADDSGLALYEQGLVMDTKKMVSPIR